MATSTQSETQYENFLQEIRRGALPLAVLASLRREFYGYTLRQHLAALGLAIDESTLYPLLRRLETQGLLTSEWREHEKRTKRFYRLSPLGTETLARLLEEWRTMNEAVDRIVGESAGDDSAGELRAVEEAWEEKEEQCT